MKDVWPVPTEEFRTTEWSGGTTTELFIWPEGSSYKERRFGARISTALVELESSSFTRLEGVRRFLTPLCAGFKLTVNGEKIKLPKGKVLEFSGEDEVFCEGAGRDLNLMLKGESGVMKLVSGGFAVYESGLAFLFTESDNTLEKDGEVLKLSAGEFLRIGVGAYRVGNTAALFLIDPGEAADFRD
jgi:environmental stress-induced protein Ves